MAQKTSKCEPLRSKHHVAVHLTDRRRHWQNLEARSNPEVDGAPLNAQANHLCFGGTDFNGGASQQSFPLKALRRAHALPRVAAAAESTGKLRRTRRVDFSTEVEKNSAAGSGSQSDTQSDDEDLRWMPSKDEPNVFLLAV